MREGNGVESTRRATARLAPPTHLTSPHVCRQSVCAPEDGVHVWAWEKVLTTIGQPPRSPPKQTRLRRAISGHVAPEQIRRRSSS